MTNGGQAKDLANPSRLTDGDPELAFAGVSSGRAHTLSHLVPAVATQALPSRPATSGSQAPLLLRLRPLSRGVCPRVSPRCAGVSVLHGAVWPSPRHHAGPGAPAPSSQDLAAGEGETALFVFSLETGFVDSMTHEVLSTSTRG
ncbi:hypothetical protein NN561_014128 [Cricetulus griseus]